MSRGDFVRIIGLPGVINRIYPEEMFVAVQCRKGIVSSIGDPNPHLGPQALVDQVQVRLQLRQRQPVVTIAIGAREQRTQGAQGGVLVDRRFCRSGRLLEGFARFRERILGRLGIGAKPLATLIERGQEGGYVLIDGRFGLVG